MIRYLTLALFALCLPASAQTLRAQSDDGLDAMLLFEAPCPAHILSLHGVSADYTLHLANLTTRDGKQYIGCYLEHGGAYVTIWDDGDVIVIATGAFTPVSGAPVPRAGKLDA